MEVCMAERTPVVVEKSEKANEKLKRTSSPVCLPTSGGEIKNGKRFEAFSNAK